MKLKEIVDKKLEIDRFISKGSDGQQIERALDLQPEMADFELATTHADSFLSMCAGADYNLLIKIGKLDINMNVPEDITTKFDALYKKYLELK